MTTVAPSRYSTLAIAVHWATFACLALALGVMLALEWADLDLPRKTAVMVHRSAGFSVLLLTLLRLPLRIWSPRPAAPEPTAANRLAQGLHHLFYLLLFALPLAGWLLTSYMGKPVTLFGHLQLPALAPADEDRADLLKELHEWAGWSFAALIALHAAAAIVHQVRFKDGVLYKMLPLRLVRPQRDAARARVPASR